MGNGAAQGFGVDLFPDGGFYEVRAGQEDGAVAFHHDGLVAHNGKVGAARDAGAQDNGDLRDAHGAHARVIAEDAAEMLFIREDLVLHRQKTPALSTR